MNIATLREKLEMLGITPNEYSLNEGLYPDRVILHDDYVKWEVFYFSERGTRHNERIFASEREACEYMYSIFDPVKP